MPERKRPKLNAIMKGHFKDWDNKFKAELDGLRKKYPLRDDLTRAVLEMGVSLDREFYRTTGKTKAQYERLSYSVRALRYTNKLFSETSREALMIKKAVEGGVSTENMIAELLFGKSDKYKVDGDLLIRINDERVLKAGTWDTLDVIAHHITELWMDDLKRRSVLPVREEFTKEELQFLTSQTEIPNFVIVSWENYKRLLGKSGTWNKNQCKADVLTLRRLNYAGTLRFPTKDHGQVGFQVADSFASIFIPEDEKAWNWVRDSAQFHSQAKALEDGGGFIVNFTGHIWGMLFFLNDLNREVRMLPKRFYGLSARARLMFRLTLPRPRGKVTIDQIVKIMGWKEKVSSEGLRLRLIEIQEIWQELSEAGFIKKVPEPVDEKGVLCWSYEHCGNWFSDQKTLGNIWGEITSWVSNLQRKIVQRVLTRV